ncbi:hypothetical protein QUB22_01590 [Microcoleus sp. AT9_A5]
MILESWRSPSSHSVVPAIFNSISTVCLASGLKESLSRHHSANVLFPDRTSAAFADTPFPGNARSTQQVSAIDFGNFMCLCATMSAIILYL